MRAPYAARPFLPLTLAALLLSAACSDPGPPASEVSPFDSSAVQEDTTFDASLAQILRRQERFRVFTTLLDSAGLLSALDRGGPFTVFAATDPGIEKMPEGLISELLLPSNRDRLRQVVGYHLHRGQLNKSELRDTSSITTLTGQQLPVRVEGGRVLIGEQRTSEFAITGSNGRIFAFDALALPPVGDASLPTDLDLGPYAPSDRGSGASGTGGQDNDAGSGG